MAIRAAVAAVVLAASAACSPSSADRSAAGPTATVRTEPPAATVRTEPPRSTTTTTNPYAVPAVIDAAYVNRVLAGLDAAVGDVTRLVIRTRTIPREAYDRLSAIYANADFLQIKIDGYQRDIREGFSSYAPNPGNKVTTATQVLSARSTCIFVRVNRDYSGVGTTPLPQLDIQWVGLRTLDSSRDPNHYNPTSWAYIYDGFPRDRTQPTDPCVS